MKTASNTNRDGELVSPWQIDSTVNKPLIANTDTGVYDCLIIGAGITGVTAALNLQTAGKKTLIAEAHTIGFGTTGGTSAHINTFADTTYSETESAFGEEGARLFAQAIQDGFNIIENNIGSYSIKCDFEYKDGYVYAEDEQQIKQLDDLYSGTEKVGVAIEYTDEVPIKVPFQKAVKLPNQAQFQPLNYLHGIVKAYIDAGGQIVENTFIDKITTEDGVHHAQSGEVVIKAQNVIYATHLPPGINVFNFKCAPYRSYVLAVKLKNDDYPDALVYDLQEPYHYFRTHNIDGQPLLLVGGNDHKTGHDDPEKAFAHLEKYVRSYYNVSSVKYRWSSQYYVPVDGLPYAGQMPLTSDSIYCATGYNGNGMMLGSVCGKLLSDLILGNDNAYTKLFNAKRVKPIDGFMEFVKENADVAYHFVADRFGVHETDSLKRLQPGTGKVVEVDGEKIAAYRDEKGKIHALSPVCTHAKCIVNWNAEEKSWDCPCHGARYDIDGMVITGPATRALSKLSV